MVPEDNQQHLLERIQSEFQEIIQRNFPGHFLRGGGYSGNVFNAYFASENKYFKPTDYFYRGELKFVHFTSIQNLFSILNSRTIRLYNLHNSNDTEEYRYSAQLFEATQGEIENRKNRIFTFSFCPVSELASDFVWRRYGNDYRGVAIVFEIVNDPMNWDNFYMSEIQYSLSAQMQGYMNELGKLRSKYSGAVFRLEMEKLMAFHKEKKWAQEKEIRILTYNPFGYDYIQRKKFSKKELKIEPQRNRFTEYIEHPIWVKNDSAFIWNKDPRLDTTQIIPKDFFIHKPQIKLCEIYFGNKCGLAPADYRDVRDQVEQIVQSNFGYRLVVGGEMVGNLAAPI